MHVSLKNLKIGFISDFSVIKNDQKLAKMIKKNHKMIKNDKK